MRSWESKSSLFRVRNIVESRGPTFGGTGSASSAKLNWEEKFRGLNNIAKMRVLGQQEKSQKSGGTVCGVECGTWKGLAIWRCLANAFQYDDQEKELESIIDNQGCYSRPSCGLIHCAWQSSFSELWHHLLERSGQDSMLKDQLILPMNDQKLHDQNWRWILRVATSSDWTRTGSNL